MIICALFQYEFILVHPYCKVLPITQSHGVSIEKRWSSLHFMGW